MPFKKITRKVKKVEPEPRPDPNQLNIITEIEKAKVTPRADGLVKWSDPIQYNPDSTSLGMVIALQPFNPLAEHNVFALFLYSMQKPGAQYRRLIMLNQDLSFKADPNGKHIIQEYHVAALAYVGYARGAKIID